MFREQGYVNVVVPKIYIFLNYGRLMEDDALRYEMLNGFAHQDKRNLIFEVFQWLYFKVNCSHSGQWKVNHIINDVDFVHFNNDLNHAHRLLQWAFCLYCLLALRACKWNNSRTQTVLQSVVHIRRACSLQLANVSRTTNTSLGLGP